jgi:hypothetical protein
MIRRLSISAISGMIMFHPAISGDGKSFVSEEPIKYAPLLQGVPTGRVHFGRIDEENQSIYIGKASFLFKENEFKGSRELSGFEWVRIGGGVRKPQSMSGSGFYFEYDLYMANWRFTDSFYKYHFFGLQPFSYIGWNYIGTRIFTSAGIGLGLNVGLHEVQDGTSLDHEAPPAFISNPPIGIVNQFIPMDFEISLGLIFW